MLIDAPIGPGLRLKRHRFYNNRYQEVASKSLPVKAQIGTTTQLSVIFHPEVVLEHLIRVQADFIHNSENKFSKWVISKVYIKVIYR